MAAVPGPEQMTWVILLALLQESSHCLSCGRVCDVGHVGSAQCFIPGGIYTDLIVFDSCSFTLTSLGRNLRLAALDIYCISKILHHVHDITMPEKSIYDMVKNLSVVGNSTIYTGCVKGFRVADIKVGCVDAADSWSSVWLSHQQQ